MHVKDPTPNNHQTDINGNNANPLVKYCEGLGFTQRCAPLYKIKKGKRRGK